MRHADSLDLIFSPEAKYFKNAAAALTTSGPCDFRSFMEKQTGEYARRVKAE
jgi:hypothetical protein